MQQQDQSQVRGSKKPGLLSRTKNSVKTARPERLLTLLRVTNILCALCTIILAISTSVNIVGDDIKLHQRISIFVVALSAICFSLIVLVVEIPIPFLGSASIYKGKVANNFGFLYTHRGKALMIFFLGIMCISATTDSLATYAWSIALGIVVMVNALCACFFYYVHPSLGDVDLFPESSIHYDNGYFQKSNINDLTGAAGGSAFGTASNNATANSAFGNLQRNSSARVDEYQFGTAKKGNQASYTTDYADSPFAIEESDNEFVDYALSDKPFLNEGSSHSPRDKDDDDVDQPFAVL